MKFDVTAADRLPPVRAMHNRFFRGRHCRGALRRRYDGLPQLFQVPERGGSRRPLAHPAAGGQCGRGRARCTGDRSAAGGDSRIAGDAGARARGRSGDPLDRRLRSCRPHALQHRRRRARAQRYQRPGLPRRGALAPNPGTSRRATAPSSASHCATASIWNSARSRSAIRGKASRPPLQACAANSRRSGSAAFSPPSCSRPWPCASRWVRIPAGRAFELGGGRAASAPRAGQRRDLRCGDHRPHGSVVGDAARLRVATQSRAAAQGGDRGHLGRRADGPCDALRFCPAAALRRGGKLHRDPPQASRIGLSGGERPRRPLPVRQRPNCGFGADDCACPSCARA